MKTISTQLKEIKAVTNLFLALLMLMISFRSLAQPCRCGNGGYTTSIYQNTIIATNVQYTQNASANYDGTTEQESMDIWGPLGDNCSERPVIIWVHGGGFAQGDKTAPDVVALCDSFSRKGFICATIDYRDDYWGQWGPVNDNSTNPNPYDTYEFTRADYRAMQDAKCAVRYFKANASTYGIDTSNIFMGGTSAGGWTSLMVAFLNKTSEKFQDCSQQSMVAGMYARPDLGGIDGNGGWNTFSSCVRGIISIFGALPDTALVDGPNDPAAIFFHEYGDPVVNFYYGKPYQGQYANYASYWGDYYVNMQMANTGGTHKAFWINGNQHSLYPYRGMVTLETSKFLDSLICTLPTAANEFPVSSSLFQVYPNPSNGIFELETGKLRLETAKIQAFNAVGKMVLSEPLNQNKSTINLSQQSNDIYFIKVTSGESILTEKVFLYK